MNRYRVHIESDFSSAVPVISAFQLLYQGKANGIQGASKDTVEARLDTVSTGIGESMQSPCYLCDHDEEPLSVLIDVVEGSSSVSFEYHSICPACLSALSAEMVPVLSMDAFQERVTRLEQAAASITTH